MHFVLGKYNGNVIHAVRREIYTKRRLPDLRIFLSIDHRLWEMEAFQRMSWNIRPHSIRNILMEEEILEFTEIKPTIITKRFAVCTGDSTASVRCI
jgi:hypothetical protein